MEYYCHVWTGALSCYLNMLDKLQKLVCKTVNATVAASLEPLCHCQAVASFSSSFEYYFGSCSTELVELAEWVPLPYSHGRYTCYSKRFHDFSLLNLVLIYIYCHFNILQSKPKINVLNHLKTMFFAATPLRSTEEKYPVFPLKSHTCDVSGAHLKDF